MPVLPPSGHSQCRLWKSPGHAQVALIAMCSMSGCLGVPAAWACTYSQRLDGLQRGEEPLADGLQLVVIQGEQVEVLQVLKRVDPQAVDLVSIEEAASRREAGDSLTLVIPRGLSTALQGLGCRAPGAPLSVQGSCCRAERGTRIAVATDTQNMPRYSHAQPPRTLGHTLP